MVQNNKVLTVSYGTFSCTLEGFEDSFGTMKAIAEYFRDLAADDRYFGAEPPQPDADMLARIAQREIARQVEARAGADGIHLRASTPTISTPTTKVPVDSPPAAEAASLPPVAAASAATRPMTEGGNEVASEPTPMASAVNFTTNSGFGEGFAAGLMPDASTSLWGVSTSLTAPADSNTPKVATGAETPKVSDPVTRAPAAASDVAEGPAADAESADDVEDLTAEPLTTPRTAPAAQPLSQTPGSSIVEKLQRIRAVVAQSQENAEEFTEDEHADTIRETAQDQADNMAGLDDNQALADADPAPHADEARLSALIGAIAADDTPAPRPERSEAADDGDGPSASAPQEDTVGPASAQSEPPQNDAPQKRGRVIRVKRAQVAQTLIEATAVEVAGQQTPEPGAPETQSPAPSRVPAANEASAAPAPVKTSPPIPSTLSPEDEDELMAELAAVEAELAHGSAPAADAGTASTDDVADDWEDADWDSDTGDLAAQIEEWSDDTDDDIDTEIDSDEEALAEIPRATPVASDSRSPRPLRPQQVSTSAPVSPRPQPVPAPLPAAQASAEAELPRLMETARHRLSDTEATESRETYHQLRAAVAAAQAEAQEDEDALREAKTRAYREDLASVVRPHRPTAGDARPAPLKLVAAQRIDDEPAQLVTPEAASRDQEPAAPVAAARQAPVPPVAEDAAQAPVRPRRVSSGLRSQPGPIGRSAGETGSTDGAFARFAEDQGAAELQELLEAAASYMSFVEGRESFSRPQLINKVRTLDGAEGFNREDSLRSFGVLLREGKLERAANGRYTVSDQIGFRPADRAAG